MKIDWFKILKDCLKVIVGAIAGASISACAFVPVF